jgi:hypothetical protein
MIFGPAASDSAGAFFKRPIFSAWDNSLSPTLVWTQRPTMEPSASAVLAFLAAAPVAAPAAVELLLPMVSVCSEDCGNGVEGEELQEQCAGKKTVAAAWDRLFTLPLLFIPPLEIYVGSQPSTTKWKRPS